VFLIQLAGYGKQKKKAKTNQTQDKHKAINITFL
jgi:hypothetical protein